MTVELKFFNRWGVEGIQVMDPGLKKYITLDPVIVPKTGARYAKYRFYKSSTSIVERLINRLMVPGHNSKKHFLSSGRNTGKAASVYKIVEDVLATIEKKLDKNPIEVLVKAVENAAPREEIITIEYGGARYPKAVECAPQRRIDIALKIMTQTSYAKSFGKKISFVDVLAEELISAYNLSNKSSAIAKKLEVERQADSSR